MALGDGCLRGLSLGCTCSLTTAVHTPAAGNATIAVGLNPEVKRSTAPASDSHETGGVLRGDRIFAE